MNWIKTAFYFWLAVRMNSLCIWLGDKKSDLGDIDGADMSYRMARKFYEHARRISPERFDRRFFRPST